MASLRNGVCRHVKRRIRPPTGWLPRGPTQPGARFVCRKPPFGSSLRWTRSFAQVRPSKEARLLARSASSPHRNDPGSANARGLSVTPPTRILTKGFCPSSLVTHAPCVTLVLLTLLLDQKLCCHTQRFRKSRLFPAETYADNLLLFQRLSSCLAYFNSFWRDARKKFSSYLLRTFTFAEG